MGRCHQQSHWLGWRFRQFGVQDKVGLLRPPLADVVDPAPPVVKCPAKQKDVPPQPFIVGEGLPVVPAKLVAKIHMAELLKTTLKQRDAVLLRKGSRVTRF